MGLSSYVLDAIFQSNLAILPQWDPHSRTGNYLGHSPFNQGSVALVPNPETGHFLPQFYVVFDDEFKSSIHESRHNNPKFYRSCAIQITKWYIRDY